MLSPKKLKLAIRTVCLLPGSTCAPMTAPAMVARAPARPQPTLPDGRRSTWSLEQTLSSRPPPDEQRYLMVLTRFRIDVRGQFFPPSRTGAPTVATMPLLPVATMRTAVATMLLATCRRSPRCSPTCRCSRKEFRCPRNKRERVHLRPSVLRRIFKTQTMRRSIRDLPPPLKYPLSRAI